MTFQQKLDAIVEKNNSLLCVGLDPELEKLPGHVKKSDAPLFTFNKSIIDATHDLVCAYKPNSAFYEAEGIEGIRQLKQTIDYIHTNHPDIPVILDAKRADIGNTNNGYIKFTFEYLGADALTIQPYPGKAALQPFLDQKDKGIIVWCKTSNPGSGEFQDMMTNEAGQGPATTLYEYVAKQVVHFWNTNNNCLLVVGATYPEELKKIRKIAGDMTFLVPGIGAQGGDVEKTVRAGLNSKKAGMIVNSSRGMIFAEDPRKAATDLRDEINRYR